MSNESPPCDERAVEAALRQHGARTAGELDSLHQDTLKVLLGSAALRAAIGKETPEPRSCTCEAPSDSPLWQMASGPLDVLHTLLLAACAHRYGTGARERAQLVMIRGQARALYYGTARGARGFTTGHSALGPTASMERLAYCSRPDLEARYGDTVATILDERHRSDREQIARALDFARAGGEALRAGADVAREPETTLRNRVGRRRRQAVRESARSAREGGIAAAGALTDAFPAARVCVAALEGAVRRQLDVLSNKHARVHMLAMTAVRAATHFEAMVTVLEEVHSGALPGIERLARRRGVRAGALAVTSPDPDSAVHG